MEEIKLIKVLIGENKEGILCDGCFYNGKQKDLVCEKSLECRLLNEDGEEENYIFVRDEDYLIEKIDSIPDSVKDEDELKTYLIDKWASEAMVVYLAAVLRDDKQVGQKEVSEWSYDAAYEMWDARQERLSNDKSI